MTKSICSMTQHIHSAMLLATFTTGLSHFHFPASYTYLPLPYLHHSMSMNASGPCRHLTTQYSDPTRESIRVPVTSLNQATADAMRDAATLGITTPLPTPEILNPRHHSFLPPFPLPFPLCTAQTPSCLPVNQTPHIRPLLTRLSTKCFIQVRRFRPRIRLTSDILIITSSYHFSSASPGLISATDWGATPEERGSLMYSLCEAKDARHYPVVTRATRVGTMTTPDPRAPVTGHRLRPSHREFFAAGTYCQA